MNETNDGRSGARGPRNHGQALCQPDDEIHRQGKARGIMIAGVQVHLIDPQQDRAADDKREADDPDVEQYSFDKVVGERADNSCRQECQQHPDDETPRRWILEHAERDLPDAYKIDRQQRQDGAKLDQHRKSLAEVLVIETEEPLHQKQVAGGGHG